jgi:hypothetical protein
VKVLPVVTLCCVSVILALVIPFPGRAAGEPRVALQEELIRLEKQSWAAWQKHDGKFFETFLSDDHAEVGFGGLTSKGQVVDGVASGVCEVANYTLNHFELRMLRDDVALLTYYEAQETNCQGKAVPSPCWVSSLYMKRGGRWLNVLYQQTPTAK